MKSTKFATTALMCLSAAIALSGCGGNSDSKTKTTENKVAETMQSYEPESETEATTIQTEVFTEDSKGDAKGENVEFKVNSVKKADTKYNSDDTQFIIANITITNNTDKDLEPNYLSSFVLTNDGESVEGTSTRAEILSRRDGKEELFPNGIKAGSSETSDLYLEVPAKHGDLVLGFYPNEDSITDKTTALQCKLEF